MTNDDKLFELMTTMYGEMQDGLKKIAEELKEVKENVNKIDSRTTIIEEGHGKKLTLLLDGYKQNVDKLDRIEKEVSKHEEVILRRVK